MAIFTATQISWSEPWFFLARIRERPGWIKRLIAAVVLSVIMFLAMYFGGRHVALGLPQVIGVSLLCGFALVLLLDVPNFQRDVTIKEDCVIIGNSFGRGNFYTFEWKHVQSVELLRPEDWNRPWGAMLIELPNDVFLAAVPTKVSLPTVADILHRLEVPVALRGWEPSPTDTRIQVQEEVAIRPEQVRGIASIRPIEPEEPKLTPPATMAASIAIGLGPSILTLLALIGAGIYVAMKWGTLSVTERVLIPGVALGAFILSVVFLIFVGQFLAAAYAVRVGEKQLRRRASAIVQGDETELIPVEVFDRTAWTSVMAKTIDSGFLQIDRSRRLVRFEGDKNRWEIPADALTACRIEQSHVGSEANQSAEKRYFVTLACQREDEPWEVGLTRTRTVIGSDGAEQRSARAQTLFQQIAGTLQA